MLERAVTYAMPRTAKLRQLAELRGAVEDTIATVPQSLQRCLFHLCPGGVGKNTLVGTVTDNKLSGTMIKLSH